MEFLSGLGINPKKALSQNFLIDGNIIRKIVAAAKVEADDVILEIGPGPGSLTEALLETGARVIAVELDKILAQALERLKSPARNLDIHCCNILDFALENLSPGKKMKVIANLPYNVTTPIISKLVTRTDQFSTLTLMVQEEVARRFTANSGNSDYSSFTVFLNFYSKPKYVFGVSKNCFFPPPKVESAIVSLELHKPPYVSDTDRFFKLTRTAFEHRRKMLRASLKDLYVSKKVTNALEELGLNPLARPEELSLEDFLKLFDKLATGS